MSGISTAALKAQYEYLGEPWPTYPDGTAMLWLRDARMSSGGYFKSFATIERTRKYARKYRETNIEVLCERARERNRKYYEANREAVREYARKYHEANLEMVRERKRKRYEANREAERERSRKYYEANREAVREHQRKYREANLEAERERRRMHRGGRPGEEGLTGSERGRVANRFQRLRAQVEDQPLMATIEAFDPRRAKLMRAAAGETTPWARREAILQLLKHESNPTPPHQEVVWPQSAVSSAETPTPLPLPKSE